MASLTTGLATGAVIAALPMLLSALGANPDQASSGGVATVIDGRRTAAGWLQVLEGAAFAGAVGAAAGGVFWAVLRWTGALKGSTLTEPSLGRSRVALGGAAAAAIAVALLPAATADRSCHDPFRSLDSSMTVTLDLKEADWPRLSAVLAGFAGSQGLSFRDLSQKRPEVALLSLSVCRAGLIIGAEEQVWRGTDVPGLEDQGVRLHVYPVQPEPWGPTAQVLVVELERAFPGRVNSGDPTNQPTDLTSPLDGGP